MGRIKNKNLAVNHFERVPLAYQKYQNARLDWGAALFLKKEGLYNASLNRIYYTVFHLISAINCMDGIDTNTHKECQAEFNKRFLKTQVLPRKFSKYIRALSDYRDLADYADYYFADYNDVETAFSMLSEMYDTLEPYLKEQIDYHIATYGY